MKEREELFPYYYLNTRYNKFKNDKTFWLMSYSLIFKFIEPLSETEQAEFIEFLRSNAYDFSPFSVCNYFLKKRIEYRVKFKYSMTLSWDYNCANHECYKAVKRRLKKVEPYRWHTIYKNDKNYTKKIANVMSKHLWILKPEIIIRFVLVKKNTNSSLGKMI